MRAMDRHQVESLSYVGQSSEEGRIMSRRARRVPATVAIILAASGWAFPLAAHAAVPTCFGRPATMIGTNGPDSFSGDPYVTDVIVALGGNDFISGGRDYPTGAPDYICAGPGADYISGSSGADHILGGDGNDEMEGSFGGDYMDGNVGDDKVYDVDSEYEDVSDTLKGSQGNDILYGDYGADTLYGGDGADHLTVGSCHDVQRLYGGPGNDRLEAWMFSYEGTSCAYTGVSDRVQGDGGFDTAIVNRADRVFTVEKRVNR